MQYTFKKKKLEDLYFEGKGENKYPSEVVDAFFRVMASISAANDIRDFYNLKSLHFEKLKGKRKNDHSMRLNKQYRLTMEIVEQNRKDTLLILDIEDYHD